MNWLVQRESMIEGDMVQVTMMMMMMVTMMMMMMIMTMMVTQHIPTMTRPHNGGEMSALMKVGMCQCQKPTIHHDELYFGVYMYQVTHITSGSFGMNFQIESATESGSATHLVYIFYTCGQEDNGASH